MLCFTGCGTKDNQADPAKEAGANKLAGIRITVLLPPWYEFSPSGIKVDLQIMDWDWVRKFGAAGWCEPLNDHFTSDFFEDISTKDLFKYKDHYITIPIYNDFPVTYINKDYKFFNPALIALIVLWSLLPVYWGLRTSLLPKSELMLNPLKYLPLFLVHI
ncbi:MAG: hypothetical protein PHP26_03945 [Syntrophomonas sp.]|jgi:hypothetical protein|uniref:hypothetical protein n=1 Tax=Syntrophomonas sp. TaxID=2053627 RepID=UPI00261291CE|nr:hypothetical protein [Syntrophomonas sp.]MDD2510404.1 hypothetical protein [Syntrophomonas sp.]MDD3879128.1 hypothetical protein [Syntrophomonas sp.]MDD4625574.1 hypothetical protein [Syntrophomonas sp.]